MISVTSCTITAKRTIILHSPHSKGRQSTHRPKSCYFLCTTGELQSGSTIVSIFDSPCLQPEISSVPQMLPDRPGFSNVFYYVKRVGTWRRWGLNGGIAGQWWGGEGDVLVQGRRKPGEHKVGEASYSKLCWEDQQGSLPGQLSPGSRRCYRRNIEQRVTSFQETLKQNHINRTGIARALSDLWRDALHSRN